MEALNIEATKDSPKIALDPNTGQCEISGRSFPEDCNLVYEPVVSWLEAYTGNSIQMRFDLDYISSTTYISLLKIMLKLKDLETTGKTTTVTWIYEDDDEDIRIAGEKFEKATGKAITFESKPV